MLRIAGRGEDGLAKAIKTDNQGNIGVRLMDSGVTLKVSDIDKYIYSKNLLDKSKIINSSFIKIDGTSSNGANAGWIHTDYISVTPGSTIVFNNIQASTANGTAFYKGKTFVSFISSSQIAAQNNVITVPQNADTMRSTNYSTNVGTWQIEYGTSPTPYEPYSSPKAISEIVADWIKNDSLVSTRKDGITLGNYEKFVDKEKYTIWKYNKQGNYVRAIYRDVAVRGKATEMEISTKGVNGPYDYKIYLDANTFPGLIAGSSVNYIMLIPWHRNRGAIIAAGTWRMIVVTNKGQVYHNFPSRAVNGDGTEVEGDIIRFEESAVWDIKGRKHPSKDKNASGVEYYNPSLPDTAYEYHPVLNTDPSFSNPYGNGGFGKSITHGNTTFARFYEPGRYFTNGHSFMTMGGFEPGEKVTVLGSYVGNEQEGGGTRMCVLATADGGRTWYNKFEFAGSNGYKNWRADINTAGLSGDYSSGSFVAQKRSLVVPSAENKEPDTMFSYGNSLEVISITKAKPAVVTTATPHGLGYGDAVIFKDNSNSEASSSDWNWMRNDSATDNSGGNGMIFKVKVLTSTTFSLHEYVASPYHNIPARHIHHINAVKDGWIVGTGEVYPDGWTYFLQFKEDTSFDGSNAYTDLPAYRLNSSDASIQRSLGTVWLDDFNSTIFTASDSYVVPRPDLSIPGRTLPVSRASSGVFKGKLADIDDFKNKFECVFETRQTAYYFKEKLGVFLFIGINGEIGISFDKGETWHREEVWETGQQYFFGISNNLLIVSDLIFEFK